MYLLPRVIAIISCSFQRCVQLCPYLRPYRALLFVLVRFISTGIPHVAEDCLVSLMCFFPPHHFTVTTQLLCLSGLTLPTQEWTNSKPAYCSVYSSHVTITCPTLACWNAPQLLFTLVSLHKDTVGKTCYVNHAIVWSSSNDLILRHQNCTNYTDIQHVITYK